MHGASGLLQRGGQCSAPSCSYAPSGAGRRALPVSRAAARAGGDAAVIERPKPQTSQQAAEPAPSPGASAASVAAPTTSIFGKPGAIAGHRPAPSQGVVLTSALIAQAANKTMEEVGPACTRRCPDPCACSPGGPLHEARDHGPWSPQLRMVAAWRRLARLGPGSPPCGRGRTPNQPPRAPRHPIPLLPSNPLPYLPTRHARAAAHGPLHVQPQGRVPGAPMRDMRMGSAWAAMARGP
jgi:hypothetical protein